MSAILQENPPRKYYLSRKACLGILRRAEKRGKPLPSQLEAALKVQAGLTPPEMEPGFTAPDSAEEPRRETSAMEREYPPP